MRYRKPKDCQALLKNYAGILFPIKPKDPVFSSAKDHRGRWSEVFGNDHPIVAELGMGKGHFLMANAALHPEQNFIGIEKQEALLLSTCHIIEKRDIRNLRLISADAADLDEIFGESELQGMYIQFCDPWPKARHHKRRLTHRSKLALYDRLLEKNSFFQFKTDNWELFSFTQQELQSAGYVVEEIHRDVKPDALFGGKPNLGTQYEQYFRSRGQTILGIYGRTPKRHLENFEKN